MKSLKQVIAAAAFAASSHQAIANDGSLEAACATLSSVGDVTKCLDTYKAAADQIGWLFRDVVTPLNANSVVKKECAANYQAFVQLGQELDRADKSQPASADHKELLGRIFETHASCSEAMEKEADTSVILNEKTTAATIAEFKTTLRNLSQGVTVVQKLSR